MDRLRSGDARLDEILNGGLLANAINLIVGIPGSGKTLLSQQFVFHNATREHPALFLSTMSEPLDKILRYGESSVVMDAEALLRAAKAQVPDIFVPPVLAEKLREALTRGRVAR